MIDMRRSVRASDSPVKSTVGRVARDLKSRPEYVRAFQKSAPPLLPFSCLASSAVRSCGSDLVFGEVREVGAADRSWVELDPTDGWLATVDKNDTLNFHNAKFVPSSFVRSYVSFSVIAASREKKIYWTQHTPTDVTNKTYKRHEQTVPTTRTTKCVATTRTKFLSTHVSRLRVILISVTLHDIMVAQKNKIIK
uniref:Uncharacterized protein n=1 Tax=Timema poppense TaxID=170557 RepID=A0A7R9CJQ6_TIMPO|nr:unnamed protein product [Timema poppensis]